MFDNASSEEGFFTEKVSSLSEFIYSNRINIFLVLLGLIMLGSGVLIYRNSQDSSEIEIVENAGGDSESGELIVEIAGAIEKPGVYRLPQVSRVEDLLIVSGGLSADADRGWVEKYINRAAILKDGQKFYVPCLNEHSSKESANKLRGGLGDVSGDNTDQKLPININTAEQEELESLPGIGQVYAQSIIAHRPYSSVDDLITKGALKQYVYDKIKDMVVVY